MITSDFNQRNFDQPVSSAITNSLLAGGGGEKTFSGNLVISGNYSGRLFVRGTVTLESGARVTGEIIANELIMDGIFKGIATVKNRAVFHNTAAFSGNLTAEEAEYHTGCTVSGRKKVERVVEKLVEKGVEMNSKPFSQERSLGSINSIADAISFAGHNDQVFMVF